MYDTWPATCLSAKSMSFEAWLGNHALQGVKSFLVCRRNATQLPAACQRLTDAHSVSSGQRMEQISMPLPAMQTCPRTRHAQGNPNNRS